VRINSAWLEGVEFFKVGRGCSHCNGTGFEGRKALYETLIVDEKIAHEIHGQPTPEKLGRLMIEKGETTLLEKGARSRAWSDKLGRSDAAGVGIVRLTSTVKNQAIGTRLRSRSERAGDKSGFLRIIFRVLLRSCQRKTRA
jgi:hypothetical protein